MTDQKTPDGPQERLEGGSATPAPPEGLNGPQNGAERFQADQQPRGPVDWARQQAAERETGGQPSATTITQQQLDTLYADLDRYEEVQGEMNERAIDLTRRVQLAEATVGRVRTLAAELFVEGATRTHRAIGRQILNALQPPVPDDAEAQVTDGPTSACQSATGIRGLLEHVGIDTTGRDITVAGRVVDPAPAHNAGPSVRECADQDARHWNEKYAGEGP